MKLEKVPDEISTLAITLDSFKQVE